MERKIVLASHGQLAKGLLDTAQMIIGEIAYEVEVYTLQPGKLAEDFAKGLKMEIMQNPQIEYVILTDLYGASVFTAMYSLVVLDNVYLFTGMNLNMLLSVCLEHPDHLDEAAALKIQEDARAGTQFIMESVTEEEDF